MADVITTLEAWFGWCYWQVADVIATTGWCELEDVIASGRWYCQKGLFILYFTLSSEMLARTSSHTCGRMVFANIPVQGWIIDPNVYSLFDCSHLVQVLPPNNFEIVDGNIVTTDVTMVIYGRGGFQMLLEPFPKCSWGFSNVFFITVHPVTVISVYDPTLF